MQFGTTTPDGQAAFDRRELFEKETAGADGADRC